MLIRQEFIKNKKFYETPIYNYFGAKRQIALKTWEILGNPDIYIEPFFGGGSMLLLRPGPPKLEIVNDLHCMIVNFWRSVQQAPEKIAEILANTPMAEAEMKARSIWILRQIDDEDLNLRIMGDVNYCRPDLAAWWVWGINLIMIHEDWCNKKGSWWVDQEGKLCKNENGGISGTRIDLTNYNGVLKKDMDVLQWLKTLQSRFKQVRVLCGDWKRSIMFRKDKINKTKIAIYLDPPYSTTKTSRDEGCYKVSFMPSQDSCPSEEVNQFAIKYASYPNIRIAVCGYVGEHDNLARHGYRPMRWKANGGWARKESKGSVNRKMEVIWFSRSCFE